MAYAKHFHPLKNQSLLHNKTISIHERESHVEYLSYNTQAQMLAKLQETSGFNNQMAAREVATNCGIAMGMPLTSYKCIYTNYRQD